MGIIAVTLNAPDDWNDHTNMLDYAFSTTEYFPVILSGMTINTITVKGGASKSVEIAAEEDFYISENKDDKFKNITVKCDIPKMLTAPVYKGDKIGELSVFYKDVLQKKIDLLASATVDIKIKTHDDFWKNFKKILTYGCKN
ncbi:MAG: hypothetical protein IJB50_01855 [Clostridia bacterium]|nr:hypothetical protein [Clostridia bacterium]